MTGQQLYDFLKNLPRYALATDVRITVGDGSGYVGEVTFNPSEEIGIYSPLQLKPAPGSTITCETQNVSINQ